MREKSFDNFAGFVKTPGHDQQAGQADHRIAAPIGEPWIARDDGRLSVGATHGERLGPRRRIRNFRRFDSRQHRTPFAGRQFEHDHAGRIQILAKIQPTLQFGQIFDVVIPLGVGLELS